MSAKERSENLALRVADFMLYHSKGKSVRKSINLQSFSDYEKDLGTSTSATSSDLQITEPSKSKTEQKKEKQTELSAEKRAILFQKRKSKKRKQFEASNDFPTSIHNQEEVETPLKNLFQSRQNLLESGEPTSSSSSSKSTFAPSSATETLAGNFVFPPHNPQYSRDRPLLGFLSSDTELEQQTSETSETK